MQHKKLLALLLLLVCAAAPASALAPLLPGLPLLPLLAPLPPMSPMNMGGLGFLPMMSWAAGGRSGGRGVGPGPFGSAGYPLQNGPMPKELKSDPKDVKEFKKAAGLSGLSSQLPPRGTRPMSMKRFYACAPTAMPGLVVPYGALRSLGVVK